jgi:hypothetical protein
MESMSRTAKIALPTRRAQGSRAIAATASKNLLNGRYRLVNDVSFRTYNKLRVKVLSFSSGDVFEIHGEAAKFFTAIDPNKRAIELLQNALPKSAHQPKTLKKANQFLHDLLKAGIIERSGRSDP